MSQSYSSPSPAPTLSFFILFARLFTTTPSLGLCVLPHPVARISLPQHAGSLAQLTNRSGRPPGIREDDASSKQPWPRLGWCDAGALMHVGPQRQAALSREGFVCRSAAAGAVCASISGGRGLPWPGGEGRGQGVMGGSEKARCRGRPACPSPAVQAHGAPCPPPLPSSLT
jgi:hypothetical protein